MAAQLHAVPEQGQEQQEKSSTASATNAQTPSLEQLIHHSRELVGDAVNQFRDIGDLAFMELELSIASLKWWVWAVVMLSTCSVMAGTFIMSAIALMFIDTVSPAVVLLVCGGVNAVAACVLVVCINSLAKKMSFQNLRQQLSPAKGAPHDSAG